MNFYISYFAQLRNMTPKQICFSTAVWDPKWFHDFADQSHKFMKDGRIYGLRMPCFNAKDSSCRGMPCMYLPKSCKFMKNYNAQLKAMDFNEVVSALKDAAKAIADELQLDDYDIVLLVHEAPTNPCSERSAILDLFNSNGIQMTEWTKDAECQND